jgi:hypothetical protein
MPFDGDTYNPKTDYSRLKSQLECVRVCMKDGCWRTLSEIRTVIQRGTEASISARLRDFRKEKFGGFKVERRHRGEETNGLWEYSLVLASQEPYPEVPHKQTSLFEGLT